MFVKPAKLSKERINKLGWGGSHMEAVGYRNILIYIKTSIIGTIILTCSVA